MLEPEDWFEGGSSSSRNDKSIAARSSGFGKEVRGDRGVFGRRGIAEAVKRRRPAFEFRFEATFGDGSAGSERCGTADGGVSGSVNIPCGSSVGDGNGIDGKDDDFE